MSKIKHSPLPWRVCGSRTDPANVCECGMIWTTQGDHPVCKVERGEWGDTWPAIRVEPGIGGKAEAYMESMPYGEIPEEAWKANARFIVLACNYHERLVEMVEDFERYFRLGLKGDIRRDLNLENARRLLAELKEAENEPA